MLHIPEEETLFALLPKSKNLWSTLLIYKIRREWSVGLNPNQTSYTVHETADTLCFHSESNIHKDVPEHVKLYPNATTEITLSQMTVLWHYVSMHQTSPNCFYDIYLIQCKTAKCKRVVFHVTGYRKILFSTLFLLKTLI